MPPLASNFGMSSTTSRVSVRRTTPSATNGIRKERTMGTSLRTAAGMGKSETSAGTRSPSWT